MNFGATMLVGTTVSKGRRIDHLPAVLLVTATLCGWAIPSALAEAPGNLSVPSVSGESRAAGKALIRELRAMHPDESSRWSGTMKIKERGRPTVELPVTCRTVVGNGSWRVTYATPGNGTRPAEEVVIIRHPEGPSEYLRARAATPGGPLPEPSSVSADEVWSPFAGTDFLLGDLGLEFLQWEDQRVLNPGRNEMRRGRSCEVLESVAPGTPPKGYARVLSWIDREHRGLITAEAFGADQKQVKEFNLGSVAKVNGSYQLESMEMLSRQTGTRTIIEFDLDSK